MPLLDRFVPATTPLREVQHFPVAARAATAWTAVRELDFYRIDFVRRLFALRMAPDRVLARVRGRPSPVARTARIDDFTRGAEPGFRVLAESPGREVVVGAIGRVWQPRIPFRDVAAEDFADFDEPGWAKVAWSLAVAPADGEGAWVTFDLRVSTTDAASLRRFERYWRLVGPFSRAIRRALRARLTDALGERIEDDERELAGDGILAADCPQLTDAIDIEAPPARVWPWLVQMGCRRGGWYSWDLLDNGGVASARTLVPSLQHLAVGDLLPARPTGEAAFAVLELERERALVLGNPSLLRNVAVAEQHPPPYRTTWAFVLEPVGDDATHLVVRVRGDFPHGLTWSFLQRGLGAVHEFMEWKQLRTLKQRAETPVEAAPPPA